MEHTQLPVNNCPMLKEGLCRLSLTEKNPDFQVLKKIGELQAKIDLVLLELAHIEGEKTPTELRIEKALQEKPK